MPDRHEFTEAEDALIRSRRSDNWTWEAIGKSIGMSTWAVVKRAKLIGAHNERLTTGQFQSEEKPEEFHWLGTRPALPAGHPITWCAITDGTVLEGVEYPA